MDGATIQARVYAGYARAANVAGQIYQLYRPLTANAPLGNLVGSLKAALDSAPEYKFKQPNEYGDPTWFALINDATTQAGDYLSNASGTYFIAGKQFLLPVIVVECNRVVKISRNAPMGATVGAVGYQGLTSGTDVDILGTAGAFWPASILLGGRRQNAGTQLPAGAGNAGWRILLPPSVPVTLMAGDIATDELGRRYKIDSAELTDLGWRMNATELHS